MSENKTKQLSEKKVQGALHLNIHNNQAIVEIANPSHRNAMTDAMWRQLPELLKEVQACQDVRVLLLKGADNTFCSGADIHEFFSFAQVSSRIADNQACIEQAQLLLEKLPLPTIALIEGSCFGGGLGLALSCDFRIATTDSRFAITPAKLGLTYSLMSTRRLHVIVGAALCREMLLTARVLDAEQALACQLVHRLVPASKLEAEAAAWTKALAAASPFAQAAIKRTLQKIEGASDDTPEQLQELMLSAFQHGDFQEGTQAFLQKRKAVFRRL